MKKLFSVVGLVIVFSISIVYADFSVDVRFYQFTGTYTNDVEVNYLSWDFTPQTIEYGSPTAQWKVSNVYAVIKNTCTANVSEKVYLYQDNRNNAAPYTATTGRNSNKEYSGLVKANSGGGESGYAPIKYLICSKGTIGGWPTEIPTNFNTDNFYGARWFNDISDYNANTPTFKTYTQIISNNGIWVGNGEWGEYFNKFDMAVFFGAYFTNVNVGESYGTDTIKFVFVVDE